MFGGIWMVLGVYRYRRHMDMGYMDIMEVYRHMGAYGYMGAYRYMGDVQGNTDI